MAQVVAELASCRRMPWLPFNVPIVTFKNLLAQQDIFATERKPIVNITWPLVRSSMTCAKALFKINILPAPNAYAHWFFFHTLLPATKCSLCTFPVHKALSESLRSLPDLRKQYNNGGVVEDGSSGRSTEEHPLSCPLLSQVPVLPDQMPQGRKETSRALRKAVCIKCIGRMHSGGPAARGRVHYENVLQKRNNVVRSRASMCT